MEAFSESVKRSHKQLHGNTVWTQIHLTCLLRALDDYKIKLTYHYIQQLYQNCLNLSLKTFLSWSNISVRVAIIVHCVSLYSKCKKVGGGSICNENPFITSSIYALGLYAICQTKDQSLTVML